MNNELLIRLAIEVDELNQKIDKLYQFIKNKELYDSISKHHQYLLTIQYDAMKTYRKVLEARIEDLRED